ncbi:DUF1232 domain-containing protein [Sphaerochaeta halotolerans]|uniref:DUF1232 domain-containing protein n=1 Tax=Sphaerochaeta halotolerans TaxID=2293840 RepID=A0A372MHA8_9SPIR|nr:hypothetical protein [Sphaerochaeta sp.]RFU94778.1 DUF1232 domain-containing protein [Sphaerochaeta halotolerans]
MCLRKISLLDSNYIETESGKTYSIPVKQIKPRLMQRALLLKGQLTAIYYASKDKRMPLLPKVLAGFILLYALSPIDLIPDFIPVLGYLDDLIILPALLVLTIKCIPNEVLKDAQDQAERKPISLPKNWSFSILFIGFWILILWFIVHKLTQ